MHDPIPGKLIIWQAGHVVHTFTTEQVFWDWQFRDGGRRVAYSTGPTHGGAGKCVLCDVASGHLMAQGRVNQGASRRLGQRIFGGKIASIRRPKGHHLSRDGGLTMRTLVNGIEKYCSVK